MREEKSDKTFGQMLCKSNKKKQATFSMCRNYFKIFIKNIGKRKLQKDL